MDDDAATLIRASRSRKTECTFYRGLVAGCGRDRVERKFDESVLDGSVGRGDERVRDADWKPEMYSRYEQHDSEI